MSWIRMGVESGSKAKNCIIRMHCVTTFVGGSCSPSTGSSAVQQNLGILREGRRTMGCWHLQILWSQACEELWETLVNEEKAGRWNLIPTAVSNEHERKSVMCFLHCTEHGFWFHQVRESSPVVISGRLEEYPGMGWIQKSFSCSPVSVVAGLGALCAAAHSAGAGGWRRGLQSPRVWK